MNSLILIVVIGGSRVALPAATVESVVEIDALIPVPRAAPHVAGLSALRSRVLTVIDCRRALGLSAGQTSPGAGREAVVVEIEGHHYALLVDVVEDVVDTLGEPEPVPFDLGEGWERVALGLIQSEAGPLLLIDAAALVHGADLRSIAA